ncbi:hypothetical protein [Embleya sp. AB8]|uniref:hypothetical protein n=1 Tax=Embleya sp. AB8 TaxID=3156304 RepID=UPI003C792CC0
MFYARADALQQVTAYRESERAWAVRQAQLKGRYDDLPVRLVTEVKRGPKPAVRRVDRDGVAGGRELGALD